MAYLLSLLAGIAVGIGYAVIGVRSPAPPIVALIGLLGIVLGETGTTMIKGTLVRAATASAASSPASPPAGPESHQPPTER